MLRALGTALIGAVLFLILGAGLLIAIKQAWPDVKITEFSAFILTCTTAMGSLITTVAATRVAKTGEEPTIAKVPVREGSTAAPAQTRLVHAHNDRVHQ